MIGSNTMNFISIKSMKITVVGHYKDVFAVSILEVRNPLILILIDSKIDFKNTSRAQSRKRNRKAPYRCPSPIVFGRKIWET